VLSSTLCCAPDVENSKPGCSMESEPTLGEESVIRSSGADFGRLIALDVLVNPSYEHVTSHISDRSTQDAQGDAEDAHVTEIVEGL